MLVNGCSGLVNCDREVAVIIYTDISIATIIVKSKNYIAQVQCTLYIKISAFTSDR